MKQRLIGAILVAGICVSVSAAAPRGFGLGVIVGEPTGLSAKVWLNRTMAIDAAAAWSLWSPAAIQVHADVLFHSFRMVHMMKGSLPFYFGIGGRVKLANKLRAAVRIPLGMEYLFDTAPVGMFAELAPQLDLIPAISVNGSAAIGIRYYIGGHRASRE